MFGRSLLLAATVALVVAGCVAPTADVDPAAAGADTTEATRLPPPDVDLSSAIVSDHGAPYLHAVPALHSGSYRLELVGYDPLSRPGETHPLNQNSGYAAITIRDHTACLSSWVGSGGFGGATIIDFEDPANPVVLASIPTTSLQARCQFSDDGKYLFLAAYGGATPGTPLPMPLADAGSWGVSVYDASDLSDPKFLFHSAEGAQPGNPNNVASGPYHNIDTETVNGTLYVFQTYTCNVLKMDEGATKLEVVAQLDYCDHDYWTGFHPVTGTRMLVTGAGMGTAFFDITDPATPVLLGVYEGSQEAPGWHRQWPLAELVNGKAYVVVAGEECGNGKSLPYTVLDWTDPTMPVQLGTWQIPGKPEIKEPGQLCSMNSHEFNTHNGYVASGNYHAGVWVFDVGTPQRAVEPVTIGYYEPHEEPRMHGGVKSTPFAWSPDVWGAYFDDRGYVLAADWYSGFYILKIPGLTQE